METFTKPVARLCRIAGAAFFLMQSALITAYGQISYASDRAKPDSRKVRREAARYAKKNNAEDYTGSHLDMKMFTFKKGEPAQPPVTPEMASDVIYNSDVPVQSERKVIFRRKK